MLHQTDSSYLKDVAYQDANGLDIRNDILDQYRSQHRQGWYEWLFERLALPTEGRLLDLGCGPADLWVKNRPQLRPQWHIVLSDLSEGMVQEARERVALCSRPQPTPFSFLSFDATKLPFPSQMYEAVFALGLLDHLPDKNHALQEVSRILKPGGLFYASAGGRSHLQELQSLISPFFPDIQLGGDPAQFGLDNGREWLAPYFDDILLHRYQDELVFHEAEPLLAFALSEAELCEQLNPRKKIAWQWFVADHLSQHGAIRVTMEKGVFVGRRKMTG